MRAWRGTVKRAAGAAFMAVAVTAILIGPGSSSASAHATLVGSSVTAGSTVSALPRSLELTFDEAIRSSYATVALTGPDGASVPLGPPEVVDNRVSAAVPDSPQGAGSYAVAWRVVSADGHAVTGAFAFRVSSGVTAEGLSPGASLRSSSPSAEDSFVARHLVAISLGFLVVGLGVLVAWRERRRVRHLDA